MAQQQAIHKFVLGNKNLEGKNAEFQYDHGWYSIIDIVGENRNVIYKSRNAQEAYTKWNVYIGRKKERPQREHPAGDNSRQEFSAAENQEHYKEREERAGQEKWERRSRSDYKNRSENSGHQSNRNRLESRNRSENSSHQDNRNHSENWNHKYQDNGTNQKNKKYPSKKKREAHRQLEKRKARARRDWAERRRAEEDYLD